MAQASEGAACKGTKRRPVPDSPQGEYDQATTRNDQLNHPIRPKRSKDSGESDHPIDTRLGHVMASILRIDSPDSASSRRY